MANYWGNGAGVGDMPDYVAAAFKLYRNYDGNGGTFGDTSVRATSGDPSKLSVFAAARQSDGALMVMVINKLTTDLTTNVNLARFRPVSRAKVYRFSASQLGAIVRQPDLPLGAGGATATFPGRSVTLLVIPQR